MLIQSRILMVGRLERSLCQHHGHSTNSASSKLTVAVVNTPSLLETSLAATTEEPARKKAVAI